MEFPFGELASWEQYKAFLKLVLWTLSCPASQKCATVCDRTDDVLSMSSFSLCYVSVTALPVLGPQIPFVGTPLTFGDLWSASNNCFY